VAGIKDIYLLIGGQVSSRRGLSKTTGGYDDASSGGEVVLKTKGVSALPKVVARPDR
jgi:hypothetical protein